MIGVPGVVVRISPGSFIQAEIAYQSRLCPGHSTDNVCGNLRFRPREIPNSYLIELAFEEGTASQIGGISEAKAVVLGITRFPRCGPVTYGQLPGNHTIQETVEFGCAFVITEDGVVPISKRGG